MIKLPKLEQKGFAHMLLLLAAVGLIGYIIVADTFSFRDKLLNILYPKPSSFASQVPGLSFIDSSGNPITTTTSATVNVSLYSPWQVKLASGNRLTGGQVAAASTYVIYDDKLENGWRDGSYSSTINYTNTNPVYSGTDSVSVKPTSGWGALELNAPGGFSTSGYTYVQFAIRATQSNENLDLYAETSSFQSLHKKVNLSNYGGYPSTTGWTVYTIPLTDINASNKLIGDITIQNNTSKSLHTFYVDQVQLINTSNPSPTPTPTPSPTPTPTPSPTSTSSYFNTITADSPLAYWRLGELSGTTAVNAMGSSYNGTYTNSPAMGQSGALSGDSNTADGFNGSSSYMSTPYNSSLNPSGAFSVELWAYPTAATTTYRGIASSRNFPSGWVLYQSQTNTWEFWINSGSSMLTLSGGSVSLNTWTHLVATFDGTTAKLYVNGVQVASQNPTSYSPNTSASFTIGQGAPGSNFFFNGKVDEASFYNKALSASQVSTHFTSASSSTSALYTVSAVLAEDSGFTTNVMTLSPYPANPYTIPYTFLNATVGTKNLYVKFTASDGSTQTFSNSIQLVLPTSSPSPTPTPTPSPIGFGGKTWYVSKSGNNTTGDTWTNAWNELNQIKWTSVSPGDRVVIDGGTTSCNGPYNGSNTISNNYDYPSKPTNCGMVYTTALTLNKSGTSTTSPIYIQLAQDSGHNGTVVMFGGRSTSLPYCNQSSYTNQTSVANGIDTNNYKYINIDGMKRSGIIIYGFTEGISIPASTANITFTNMEIFDNGVATFGNQNSSLGSSPAGIPTGWWADGAGVTFRGGSNLIFDRMLIHDNGQDVFQGGWYAGTTIVNNMAISNSWLYISRENPIYPGFGFNMGTGEICTHPDGLQIWNGGPDNGLTVQNDIIGPYLGQGLYPTDSTTPQYNNVTLNNVLFLNVLYGSINTVSSAPTGWNMSNVTFYRYGAAPDGDLCCTIDGNSWPSGDSITNSISYGGEINDPGLGGSNNIYYNASGTTLAGGTNTDPKFTSPLTTGTSTFAQIMAADLTPTCSSSICTGIGSSLHKTQDILTTIDSLNAANP